MRLLVTYASKHGATRELAEAVAEVLRAASHEVDVKEARGIEGIAQWDAVIVGGALYGGGWLRPARRFVERHEDELERMPVWAFSAGPLDDSAAKADLPPTRLVQRLLRRIQARGHATFGGRLTATDSGFLEHALVRRGLRGDFRDFARVRQWAQDIANDLSKLKLPTRAPVSPPSPWLRRAVTALSLFTGLTALVGGAELMGWSLGAWWLPSLSVLEFSPFSSFLIPGILLFTLVGLTNAVAGLLAGRRHRLGALSAMVGGAAVSVWILVEMALLRAPSAVEFAYLLIGLLTVSGALVLYVRRREAAQSHPRLLAQ